VHDEIGISTNRDDGACRLLQHEYTDFNSETSWVKMQVPITASADYGVNWWEASKG
jgi:hypothetical protein